MKTIGDLFEMLDNEIDYSDTKVKNNWNYLLDSLNYQSIVIWKNDPDASIKDVVDGAFRDRKYSQLGWGMQSFVKILNENHSEHNAYKFNSKAVNILNQINKAIGFNPVSESKQRRNVSRARKIIAESMQNIDQWIRANINDDVDYEGNTIIVNVEDLNSALKVLKRAPKGLYSGVRDEASIRIVEGRGPDRKTDGGFYSFKSGFNQN